MFINSAITRGLNNAKMHKAIILNSIHDKNVIKIFQKVFSFIFHHTIPYRLSVVNTTPVAIAGGMVGGTGNKRKA